MMATKRPNVQTREQMWALLQTSDSALVNALLKLVRRHREAVADGSWIISKEDARFLLSLESQANQKQVTGRTPLLTARQLTCLRKALEPYQEDLWQITRERLGLPDDRPYEREDEYDPGAEEPVNSAWQQFCECGKFAQVQHMGGFYCLPCRRTLDEPQYDLRALNEMVDPR
jgi:hypothetical protein